MNRRSSNTSLLKKKKCRQSMRARNNNHHINYFFQELLRSFPHYYPFIYSSLSLFFLFVLSCSRPVTPSRHDILYFLPFSAMKFPEIFINRDVRAKNKISRKETSVEYVSTKIFLYNTITLYKLIQNDKNKFEINVFLFSV